MPKYKAIKNIKLLYSKLSIHKKLITIYLVASLIPIFAFGALAYKLTADNITKSYIKVSSNICDYYENDLHEYLIKQVSNAQSLASEINYIPTMRYEDRISLNTIFSNIVTNLPNYTNANTVKLYAFTEDMCIYTNDRSKLFPVIPLSDNQLDMFESATDYFIFSRLCQYDGEFYSNYIFKLMGTPMHIGGSDYSIRYVMASINIDNIGQIFEDYDSDEHIIITDSYSDIVYTTQLGSVSKNLSSFGDFEVEENSVNGTRVVVNNEEYFVF